MRIENVQIDGFGRFRRREFGPLSKGMTIIHDPNGVSNGTVHAFIMAILFGFPPPESDDWMASPAAGRHGGRLLLRDEYDKRILVERHSDSRSGAARIMLANGEAGDEELLNELLGNITSGMFKSIFTLGIGELQTNESPRYDVQTVETALSRGRIPTAGRILRDLKAVELELTELQSTFDDVHQLRARRDQISHDIHASEHKLAAIEQLQRELSILESAREEALERLTGALTELAGIQRAVESHAFPATASAAGSIQPTDPQELRLLIDELREAWTRLQATRRMMEVYQGTLSRQSTPRGPVFLALLITGTILPLLVGALIGHEVVISIGIASATLGAITLVLAVIARSRFDTAQTQARLHIEITHRDVEGRFFHAAMATAINTVDVDAEIERLERWHESSTQAFTSLAEIEERHALLALQQQRSDRAAMNVEKAVESINAAHTEWATLALRLGIKRQGIESPGQARAAIERERDDLLVEQGRIEERIKQREAETRGDELRARRETLLASLRELTSGWTVSPVASKPMRETLDIHTAERQPEVLRDASDIFDAMTLGTYHRLVVAGDNEEIVALARDGRHVAVTELGRGAREQAHLALRIGLIREISRRAKPLPVLIDDLRVNFDPTRATEAMRAFNNLASEHQVLIFTRHPTTVALARSLNPSTRIITVDEQRVAGHAPIRLDSD